MMMIKVIMETDLERNVRHCQSSASEICLTTPPTRSLDVTTLPNHFGLAEVREVSGQGNSLSVRLRVN